MKVNYKGKELKVTKNLNNVEPVIRDKVYDNINVDDEKVAKEADRVYIEYLNEVVKFFGDTYNQKKEIKKIAKEYNVKANWNGKCWEIKTFEIEDNSDFVDFLKTVLEKYDCSYKTAAKIKRDIRDFS